MEPIICPFWFLEAQKLKAEALIKIGFSYLGEEEFSINIPKTASIDCWTIYSIENTLIVTYEDAIWQAENRIGLLQDLYTVLNHSYQQETTNRFLREVLTGFGSNVGKMKSDHIQYALTSVSSWLEAHGKQEYLPQLETVIQGLSHE